MSNIKDQYTRKNIRSDILKLVIFRFDISGLPDFKPFVNELCKSPFMDAAFKKVKYYPGMAAFRPMKKNISANGTLPLSEKLQCETYRFSECTIGLNSDAFLDITPDNICLSINCNGAYDGSEKYTLFLINVFNVLTKVNKFIYINRLGIRKIDSVDVKNFDEIPSFFGENFVVANDLLCFDGGLESTKTDVFFINNVHYNVVQHVKKKSHDTFQLVFDVDAYTKDDDDDEIVDIDDEKLYNLMYFEMQNKMFEFFKNAASEDYLKNHRIKEK